MSHEITNNMIAWKGEEPWHGLGYKVPENATGKEMLEVAKLNWDVERRNLAMQNGQNEVLTEPLKNFKAIVRADNNTVFQVATDRYYPVQNAEVVDFFREYCEAGHATMETVGGLKGGAIVWALARLNGGSTATLQDVDELRGHMLLATSHDGSIRTIGKPTQTRVVCWNTLAAALGEQAKACFMMKHSRKWSPEVAKEAQEIMGIASRQVAETNELAAKLATVRMDARQRIQFITRLLNQTSQTPVEVPEPTADDLAKLGSLVDGSVSESEVKDLGRVGTAILESALTSPGADLVTANGTLWGMVNGVTYYADHIRGCSQETRLANAWFGSGDSMKQDAVKIASQMAGF